LKQNKWHILANDCGGLKQPLVLSRQPIDARRQHRLDSRRHLNTLNGFRHAIDAPFTFEHFDF